MATATHPLHPSCAQRTAWRTRASLALLALLAAALAAATLATPIRAEEQAAAEDAADAWVVGERIEGFALEDQHGETRRVDAATRLVLFSRDMDGGGLLRSALEDTPSETLPERDAVYVADISGMPGLVARLFAVPAMRRRPYPMLLDRTGETTARLPDVEGQATLVFLDDLVVTRVEHADSDDVVRRLLGL